MLALVWMKFANVQPRMMIKEVHDDMWQWLWWQLMVWTVMIIIFSLPPALSWCQSLKADMTQLNYYSNKHRCARPAKSINRSNPRQINSWLTDWSIVRQTHQQSDRLMNRHTDRSTVILTCDRFTVLVLLINRFSPLYIIFYCTAWWNSIKNADWLARSCCSLIGQTKWAHTATMLKFNKHTCAWWNSK